MKFHILTLFPDMIKQGLNTSIIGRAIDKGLISINPIDIRTYTLERHGKVDDYPYGGGAGMLMQAQPVFDAFQDVTKGKKVRAVYVTPQGIPFTQKIAERLAEEEELVFLCGHYEGIDERVLEEVVTDYVSIGDYVLTGGELPAMVMIDAISRLVPGVLNNDLSAETESFHNDLLEYPQYSRPEEWHGKKVPQVLLSGNHSLITKWRLEEAEKKTQKVRPDLYAKYQRKQELIRKLSKKKRNYIHMMEGLARGNADILYAEGNNILIYNSVARVAMISAENEEFGKRMIKLVPKDVRAFASSQSFLNPLISTQFRFETQFECCQACYTRREALPVRHRDIQQLGEQELEFLASNYTACSREYLRKRLQTGAIFGLKLEDKLVAFMGVHEDGSLGMLYVDSSHYKEGLEESLIGFLSNRDIQLGFVPYQSISVLNKELISLEDKMGANISQDSLWWLYDATWNTEKDKK